ncbi:MAG TPA: hypothetical protein VFL87_02140 [Thermoleophilaceae bacterium]|nr:hypothetical protein [Thermoleophilaceae bacterium]
MATGLLLALLASVALNTGYLLQHTGSAEAPAITPLRPLATLRSLLASRAWVLGLALGTFGWALHVGALSKAPLSLVQAFVAGGLALALPIGRRLFRQSLSARELWGIGLIALALGGLALGLHDSGAHGGFASGRLGLYLAGSLVAAALLVSAPTGTRRPQALGVAGGLLYGAADVAIKALTGIASRHGMGHALLTIWLPLAALATLGAFFCFQRALQAGRPLPVIALMTAATNALSIAAGFAVFGDPVGSTPGLVALHAASLGLVVAAGSLLAPAQAEAAVSAGLSRPS